MSSGKAFPDKSEMHYLGCQDDNCEKAYCVDRRNYHWNLVAKDKEIERLRAALERVNGMCEVPGKCKCGRPNGIPAIVSCATKALAGGEGV